MGNLEIISLEVWHMAAAIANLLILTAIVKKFLFKPVLNVLAERKSRVDTLYADAESAKAAAESDRAAYEGKLHQAEEEAQEILRRAAANADKISDQILAQAAVDASAKIQKATADIAQEKKKAMSELKNEISGMSVDIAEKVVGREIKEEDHRKLIDSFIENL